MSDPSYATFSSRSIPIPENINGSQFAEIFVWL